VVNNARPDFKNANFAAFVTGTLQGAAPSE